MTKTLQKLHIEWCSWCELNPYSECREWLAIQAWAKENAVELAGCGVCGELCADVEHHKQSTQRIKAVALSKFGGKE